MKKRRDKLEVLIDVLEALEHFSLCKTVWFCRANLNYVVFEPIFDNLLSLQLVTRNGNRYSLTIAGYNFLLDLKKLLFVVKRCYK